MVLGLMDLAVLASGHYTTLKLSHTTVFWPLSTRDCGSRAMVPALAPTHTFLPTPQAGQLEKALEIMVWVQCAGVKFDQTTYEELIAVTEIAEVRPMSLVQLILSKDWM